MPDRAPQSVPFARKFVRGELMLQFGNVAVKGLGIVNSFFILAALSVYHYGLYQLTLSFVAIAASFFTVVFDDVIANEIARSLAERNPERAKRLFAELAFLKTVMGFALAAAAFFGANLIAVRYGRDIGALIRIVSATFALGAVQSLEEIFLRANVSFSIFGAAVAGEIVKFLLLVSFFLSSGRLGIEQALLIYVATVFAATAFLTFFFIRRYGQAFRGVRMARGFIFFGVVRRHGMPLFIRTAVAKVTKDFRPWLVKFFINTETVALYSLAENLVTIAQSFLPTTVITMAMPWRAKDPGRFAYAFRRATKYAVWGGFVLAACGVIFVPPLVGLFFPKYARAMPLFMLMVLTLPFYGAYKILKSALIALREQGILAARLVTESVAAAGLLAFLLPLVGVMGAAGEYLISYVGRAAFYSFALARKHPAMRVRFREFFTFDAVDRNIFTRVFAEIMEVRLP